MTGAIYEDGGAIRLGDEPLLHVRDLRVVDRTGGSLLDGVDLDVAPGECLGVIGSSGAGKSTLVRAIAGLIDRDRFDVDAERFSFEGRSHGAPRRRERRRILGRRIAVVAQDAAATLHPMLTIGTQLAQVIRRHRPECRAKRRVERAVADALDGVGLDPAFARRHAHTMSGGECQRVSIAMALVGSPSLVLADEPTAGLDVVAQQGVIDRLVTTTRAHGAALVFVSHDLRVLADVADRVCVLDRGRVVETAQTRAIFDAPVHHVTRALVAALPVLVPIEPAVEAEAAPEGVA